MYALVSADFPDVTSDQRTKIYKCLSDKSWHKFENVGRDITTCWWASFESTATYEGIIQTAKEEFTNCTKPYTKPKLVIHVGENKPSEIIIR